MLKLCHHVSDELCMGTPVKDTLTAEQQSLQLANPSDSMLLLLLQLQKLSASYNLTLGNCPLTFALLHACCGADSCAPESLFWLLLQLALHLLMHLQLLHLLEAHEGGLYCSVGDSCPRELSGWAPGGCCRSG